MISSPIVRWALGLHSVPSDATELRLGWEHPLEGWVWLLAIAGTAGAAFLSYSTLRKQLRPWWLLALMRTSTLLLLVVLFAKPILESAQETTEADSVVMLVDRSRSMEVADLAGTDGQPQSRDQQLRDLIDDRSWQDAIAAKKRISWLGFHGSAHELTRDARGWVDVGPLEGWRTSMATAVEAATQRLSGRPASAVVIFSDGRSVDPVQRSTLRRLAAAGVQVITVPLGAADSVRDLSVASVDGPGRAFLRDDVPIRVDVRSGVGPPNGPVRVELVDTETSQVLDERLLTPAMFEQARASVSLAGKGTRAGTASWVVRVRGSAPDLVEANDERRVSVEFVDRPIRVLYVDAYPRWEFRYLKNLLLREPTVECSTMLLSADREFAQEGDLPLERLPQSAKELEPYDIIILGDVNAGSLSEQQQQAIREAVAQRGTGLLWIGGSRNTPSSWHGSTLAELLPMRGSLNLETVASAVWVQPTAAAARHGVMQLGDSASVGWPAVLGPDGAGWAALQWAQDLNPRALKPAAEVLAEGISVADGNASALVIAMRYGAGQTAYVATDETWRWRHGIGESLQERFWIGLIQMLARPAVENAGSGVRLEVAPAVVSVGDSTIVRLDLLDASSGAETADSVEVKVQRAGSTPSEPTETVVLLRQPDAGAEGSLGGAAFLGRWTPEEPGSFTMQVNDGRVGAPVVVNVEVTQPDEELTRPDTDHEALAVLARETGGTVIPAVEISRLAEVLPDRSLVVKQWLRDPLWSSPLALMLLLLPLLAEWVLRRLWKLE